MNTYLLGLIIPVFSFSLQIWPRLIKRYFGVDTWRWLLFADYIRRNRALPKKSPRQFIATTVFGYPPVVMLLLSVFPKKLLEKYQFVISPFFDSVNNYVIFLAALFLSNNLGTAIISQTVATLTPIVVIEASNLNSRILSYLIFTVSFFSLFIYSMGGGIVYLICAGMFLYILFFTHRFAIQAYVISILGFSLVEKTPAYIIFFLVVLGIVFITNRKLYLAILKEHLASVKYWADKIEYRFAHQFRGISSPKKTSDFIQKVYSLSLKSPLAYVFGNNPWLLLLIGIFANQYFDFFKLSSTLSPNVILKLEIWVISLIVWAILVLSVKPLRIFGEGQRYLEYCVLPTALLISSFVVPLLNQYGFFAYLLFIVGEISMLLVIIYLQHKAIILDRARSVNSDVWKIIDYINSHNGSKIRLAMFPLQLGDAMVYFTKCSILTSDLYSGLSKLDDLFPVLKKPLPEVLKKHGINHIFFDRDFVSLRELGLKKYKIVMDVNNFVLLKV